MGSGPEIRDTGVPKARLWVRLVAAAVAVSAIVTGVFGPLGMTAGISVAYMDSSTGPPALLVVAAVAIAEVPALFLLWCAQRFWADSSRVRPKRR